MTDLLVEVALHANLFSIGETWTEPKAPMNSSICHRSNVPDNTAVTHRDSMEEMPPAPESADGRRVDQIPGEDSAEPQDKDSIGRTDALTIPALPETSSPDSGTFPVPSAVEASLPLGPLHEAPATLNSSNVASSGLPDSMMANEQSEQASQPTVSGCANNSIQSYLKAGNVDNHKPPPSDELHLHEAEQMTDAVAFDCQGHSESAGPNNAASAEPRLGLQASPGDSLHADSSNTPSPESVRNTHDDRREEELPAVSVQVITRQSSDAELMRLSPLKLSLSVAENRTPLPDVNIIRDEASGMPATNVNKSHTAPVAHKVKSARGSVLPRGDAVPENKPVNNLAEVLRPILSPKGGVEDIRKVSVFHELLQQESSLKGRILLLTILEHTESEDCLQHMVDHDLFVVLNEWLTQARDHGRTYSSEGNQVDGSVKFNWQFARRILSLMYRLPANLNAVLKSQAGKTVRSLTKMSNASEDVVAEAKKVVVLWKEKFLSSNNAPAVAKKPAPGIAKRSSSDMSQAAKELKKSGAAALRPANDDSLFASKKDSLAVKAKPISMPRRKVQRIDDQPMSPTAAGHQEGMQIPNSEDVRMPADADAAAPVLKDEGTGNTTEVSMAGVKVIKEDSDKAVPPSAEQVSSASGTSSVDSVVKPNVVSIKIGLRSGVARCNSKLFLPEKKSAAQRAAEAAAKIPDEEPPPRLHPKRKSVQWKDSENLISVRLFKKDQPPSAIGGDTSSSVRQLEHDPGFESAAKREHSDERHALEMARGNTELGLDSPGGSGDLSYLVPNELSMAWCPPPDIAFSREQAAVEVAYGEESTEASTELRRERMTPPYEHVNGVAKAFTPSESAAIIEEQRLAGYHTPLLVPWEAAPAPQEPDSASVPLQPQRNVIQDSFTSIVGQMDPELVRHIQAISSAPPPPPPASVHAAAMRPPAHWEQAHHQQSIPASGWSQPKPQAPTLMRNRYFSGPPTTVPEERRPETRWGDQESSSPPQRRGTGFSDSGKRRDLGPGIWSQGPPVSGESILHGHSNAPPGRGNRFASDWHASRDYPDEDDLTTSGRATGMIDAGPRYRGAEIPAHNPAAKPCLFFNTPQGCRNGPACRFAHVRADIPQSQLDRALSAISKRQLAPDFTAGPPRSRRRT